MNHHYTIPDSMTPTEASTLADVIHRQAMGQVDGCGELERSRGGQVGVDGDMGIKPCPASSYTPTLAPLKNPRQVFAPRGGLTV